MLLVIATDAAMQEHSILRSVSSGVANRLSDGNYSKDGTMLQHCKRKKKDSLSDDDSICRYHVPRSWLKPTQNLLVVFEELGGNPSRISLVKRSMTSVCAEVAEVHPTIKNWHIESYGRAEEFHSPKVHLRCSVGQSISSIKFASFGTPLGTCGSYQQGPCHAPASYDIVEKVVLTLLHRF